MTLSMTTAVAITHKIDSRGGIHCNNCGKIIERVGFLTPEKLAPVILYRKCPNGDCRMYNTIFLDRLEMTC